MRRFDRKVLAMILFRLYFRFGRWQNWKEKVN